MNWSVHAQRILEFTLAAAARRAHQDGADGVEVADDLRARVEQELTERGVVNVSSEDVTAAFAKLGVPVETRPMKGSPTDVLDRGANKLKSGCFGNFFQILTWLIPALALSWEVVAQMVGDDGGLSCRAMFFNPIPTWMHAALIALVPFVNFIGWRNRLAEHPPGRRILFRWLWGAALAVSIWYCIRFVGTLPMCAIGFVAIIYFGIGLLALLPLSPYIGLGGLLRFGSRFNDPPQGRDKLWGFLAGAAVLLALFSQTLVTGHALRLAKSDDPADRTRGIQLLRTWGDRQELAAMCFGTSRSGGEFGNMDILGNAVGYIPPADAQQIFFRVYGEPFYTTTTMGMRRGGMRGQSDRVEVSFDTGQGGDDVGAGVTGLSLTESRVDGHIESDLALAYLEWTLVFRNTDPQQREARAQIALPPGAVVSRLTLWVDGEEREAAFAGNSQVKAAYKKVVQVLRRDPVLVTSRGPDRVMMQCFPVPPGGGTMKVRLGITVPMDVPAADRATFRLPVFLERNFALHGLGSHDVWLQSVNTIKADGTWTSKTNSSGGGAITTSLKPSATLDGIGLVSVARNADAKLLASPDPIERGGTILTQLAAPTSAAPTRIVLALDASHGMAEEIKTALAALPAEWKGVEIAAVIATRETTRSLPPRAWDAAALAAINDLALKSDYEGGQDNIPALIEAWDLAAQSPRGLVLWLHGPCAEPISQPATLRQRLERSATGPQIHDLQLAAGPHRLVENLDTLPGYVSHGIVPAADALRDLIARHRDGNAREVVRVRETAAPAGALAQNSPHPARLWANARVHELLAHHISDDTDTAAKLAARYYLVTPVSGAVVLETKQQFDEAGLTPAPNSVVTVVPEPATLLLALTGIAALLLWKFLRRKLSNRWLAKP